MSAAGAVKHEEIVDMVESLFTRFARTPTAAAQLAQENPAVFTGSEVCIYVCCHCSSCFCLLLCSEML